MTLDGGVNHLCLPIALSNSEILGKKTDNPFNMNICRFAWKNGVLTRQKCQCLIRDAAELLSRRGGDPGGVGGVRTLPEIETSYLRGGQGVQAVDEEILFYVEE